MTPNHVTAVVLARNEERNLARALESLPPGVQVIVIDHQSRDATREIAERHGATVITREFHGFVDARRFALSQVRTPWTFMLDADEVLDARLREAMTAAREDVDGFEVSRTTYYCGRAMRMWSGERLLRLFATNRATLASAPAAGGRAQLHEHWVCAGRTRLLDGTLLHYSYPTHAAYREKFERYTSLEASGVDASAQKAMAQTMMIFPRFFWYALVRKAAFDGLRGLRVAWWSALYPAVVQMKALRNV